MAKSILIEIHKMDIESLKKYTIDLLKRNAEYSRENKQYENKFASHILSMNRLKLDIKGFKEEIKQLKKEFRFKEDRISDLLVERDTGKWKDKQKADFIKKLRKLIIKINKMQSDLTMSYANTEIKKAQKQAQSIAINECVKEIDKLIKQLEEKQ